MPDSRSSSPKSLETNTAAIATACAQHLHQTLWLPANDQHGRLRVTFATTSNFSDTSLPVIFFCSPMFAGRLPCLGIGHTAKTSGVRVISVDRPGMGGSTAVPLEQRIPVWLEMLPAVLQKLNVEYIDGLVSHSAGTLFSLNTMYHLRDRLNPKRPYVAFMAPWVHQNHSDATLMAMASRVPTGVVGGFHVLNKFIATRVNPAVSWSGGIFSSMTNLFQASPGNEPPSDEDEVSAGEKHGTSDEIGKAIDKLSTKYFFAEDTSAASEEAKLCLKKCEAGSWGICEDYMDFVCKFVEMERGRRSDGGGDGKIVKVDVEVYFAESDIMTGKLGQKYFEECWGQPGVEGVVSYKSSELENTNHETVIMSLKKGALRPIFKEIARGFNEV